MQTNGYCRSTGVSISPSKTKVARSLYGNRWQTISGICTYLHAPTHAADFERTLPPPLKPIEKLSHPENICCENGPHRFLAHRKRIILEAATEVGHLIEEVLLITDLTKYSSFRILV